MTISGNEYTVHQSPTLLSSSRAGGTTGAGMYFFFHSLCHTAYIPSIISCSEPSTRSARPPIIRTNSCLAVSRLCTDWSNNPRSLLVSYLPFPGTTRLGRGSGASGPFFTSVLLGLPVRPADRSPCPFCLLFLVSLLTSHCHLTLLITPST